MSSSSKTLKNALKCTILNIQFQNFLGGDTPEPPLREGATPSRTHPPGRPTALRAFGRPAAAARPTVGTLTPGPPLQISGYATASDVDVTQAVDYLDDAECVSLSSELDILASHFVDSALRGHTYHSR